MYILADKQRNAILILIEIGQNLVLKLAALVDLDSFVILKVGVLMNYPNSATNNFLKYNVCTELRLRLNLTDAHDLFLWLSLGKLVQSWGHEYIILM